MDGSHIAHSGKLFRTHFFAHRQHGLCLERIHGTRPFTGLVRKMTRVKSCLLQRRTLSFWTHCLPSSVMAFGHSHSTTHNNSCLLLFLFTPSIRHTCAAVGFWSTFLLR